MRWYGADAFVFRATDAQYVQPMHSASSTYAKRSCVGWPSSS